MMLSLSLFSEIANIGAGNGPALQDREYSARPR